MISKAYRLNRSDVEIVKTSSKKERSPLFTLLYSPNKKNHCRFSVIVSKKIAKNATDRNRLKRKIYSILKSDQKQNQEHFDVLIIPTKLILQNPRESFSKELTVSLKKICQKNSSSI
ncbi:ribonuclease P protein component [Patescibacteria group bacterium]